MELLKYIIHVLFLTLTARGDLDLAIAPAKRRDRFGIAVGFVRLWHVLPIAIGTRGNSKRNLFKNAKGRDFISYSFNINIFSKSKLSRSRSLVPMGNLCLYFLVVSS